MHHSNPIYNPHNFHTFDSECSAFMCLRKNRKIEMDITLNIDTLIYGKVSVAEKDAISQKNCLIKAIAIVFIC